MAPLPANVRDGTYALRREVILVTRQAPEGRVKQSFDLLLSEEGQAIVAQKFVPLL